MISPSLNSGSAARNFRYSRYIWCISGLYFFYIDKRQNSDDKGKSSEFEKTDDPLPEPLPATEGMGTVPA